MCQTAQSGGSDRRNATRSARGNPAAPIRTLRIAANAAGARSNDSSTRSIGGWKTGHVTRSRSMSLSVAPAPSSASEANTHRAPLARAASMADSPDPGKGAEKVARQSARVSCMS